MSVKGPIIIEVVPYDFIDTVLQKGLTVIRSKTPTKNYYYYFAADIGITFFTKSHIALTEIQVDILVPKFGIY